MAYAKYLVFIMVCGAFMCAIADAQNKEKLTVGLMVPINVLYPWGQIILEPQYVMENIYETLMRAKEGSIEVEPCLASRIDASPDYKVWTAYLRKDVKFHDGTPLTADSVVESLSLQGSLKGKVAKIDAHTVVFSLDKPDATFPMTLSIPNYSIASLATISCYKKNCTSPVIVGTGPFKLESWRPPTNIILSANEAYWGNKPFFKKIEFISFNSDQDLLLALRKETVQLVPTIKPKSIVQIREIPNLEFRSIKTLGIGFLVMNTEKKPFNDARVRLAISYAINKKELVRKYFFGGQTGVIAHTFTPLQILHLYDESLNQDYNPEKAKALLKEAGLPDGFETTFSVAPNPRPYLPDPPEIANDIKLQLEAVGIKANIIPFAAPDGGGNPLQLGIFEISLSGWMADTIDPNDYFTALFSPDSINSSNITRWTNKKFNELIAEGRRQKDPASRLKFYQQIQVLLHQEMPFVPLIYPLQTIVWNKKLKNFIPHPLNRLYLYNISLQ